MSKTLELPIEEIIVDAGTQMRVGPLNEAKVKEYEEKMRRHVRFPDLIVYGRILADGFYRLEAAQRAGHETINCDIRNGGKREAVLYAVGANHEHGMPRSNQDMRKAVRTMLLDDEWIKWSNSEISRQCHVSIEFVRKLRHKMIRDDEITEQPKIKTKRKGKVVEQRQKKLPCNGGNEGPKPKTQDEIDCAEFVSLVKWGNTRPYDGVEAAERYKLSKFQKREAKRFRDWLNELLGE